MRFLNQIDALTCCAPAVAIHTIAARSQSPAQRMTYTAFLSLLLLCAGPDAMCTGCIVILNSWLPAVARPLSEQL